MPGSATFFKAAGTPARRKYFWAMMSVATCDQLLGTRTFSILNTIEPSGLAMTELRKSHSIAPNGSEPAWLNRLSIFRPFLFLVLVRFSVGIEASTSVLKRCTACRGREDFYYNALKSVNAENPL